MSTLDIMAWVWESKSTLSNNAIMVYLSTATDSLHAVLSSILCSINLLMSILCQLVFSSNHMILSVRKSIIACLYSTSFSNLSMWSWCYSSSWLCDIYILLISSWCLIYIFSNSFLFLHQSASKFLTWYFSLSDISKRV